MSTPTIHRGGITDGDTIVAELLTGDAVENVAVGYVKDTENEQLETSLPFDEEEFNILAIEGKDDPLPPRHQRWVDRFNHSNYQMYLRAEVRSTGDINVTGV